VLWREKEQWQDSSRACEELNRDHDEKKLEFAGDAGPVEKKDAGLDTELVAVERDEPLVGHDHDRDHDHGVDLDVKASTWKNNVTT
jgi:hypothetical protein